MGRWLYDDAMYRFGHAEASYWEATAASGEFVAEPLGEDDTCDVAIIGGGYTGLSAAYHLCRDQDLDVRVLEAGHFGWGASGRNGGFCVVGGEAVGAETMVRRYGLDDARHYYRAQVEAVQLVSDLIEAEQIDAERHGDSEVAIACSPTGFQRLKKHAEFQFRKLGLDTSVLSREQMKERHFDSPLQHGAAIVRPAFALHPLKYALGLAAAARRQGARLHALSEVSGWSKDGDRHLLSTAGGTLRAGNVIVATNGFTPEHLDGRLYGRTLPFISAIVATRPMTSGELEAHAWQTHSPSITSLNLLNYFRVLPDGRLLFGGRGSADGSAASAERNYDRLIARLHEVFPAWKNVDIEYRWHGLICMTRRLVPSLGRFNDDPSVLFGFGFHGNGVNTATWTGRQLARWLADGRHKVDGAPDWLPRVVQGMSGRFPLPRLRLKAIQAAIAWRRFLDRKG